MCDPFSQGEEKIWVGEGGGRIRGGRFGVKIRSRDRLVFHVRDASQRHYSAVKTVSHC